MKKVTVKPNQTVYDIAVEQYGTCEAVSKILADNPEVANDEQAMLRAGIEPALGQEFRFDLALKAGSTLLIDTDSRLMRKNVLREINKDVTTFDLNEYGTDN